MTNANEGAATALEGVRVLEIATLGAGPWTATLMAEFGAEVIKLEDPGTGDPLRTWGRQKSGVSLVWKSTGRNKKSATLNLRVPEGQDLLRKLVAGADVLIANSRPQTLAKWNLTYEDLRRVNDDLIMLHTTAFGLDGPYAERPGFGTLVEAMSGFAHIAGEADGPPTLPPVPLGDFVTSLTGASAVMFALYHRDVHGGGGQFIELSILEALSRMMEGSVLLYDQLGEIEQRHGNMWRLTVPRNTYRTRDARWVAMSGSANTIALRVFQAIGRPELVDDSDYNTPQARLEHVDEIDSMVADWILSRDLSEVMKVFGEHQVAAAPVYDSAQLYSDPHIRARGVFSPIDDPDLGVVRPQRPVPLLSKTPGKIDHLGPALGADNDYVYGSLLGLSSSERDRLKDEGVV